MDKNTKKILKFLCKNKDNKYSIITLSNHFNKIPKDHIIEIVHNLYKDNYVVYITDSSIKVTNKGITYLSVVRSNWISKHIIETLAFIVSLIALIISICAFIRTL